MIILDGQLYDKESDAPDIGSWVAYEVKPGNVRSYCGLNADISKLPVYNTTAHGELLGYGSTAICVDTSDVYMYHNGTWYEL